MEKFVQQASGRAKGGGPRVLRFPPMPPFERLLLHRLAERFKLRHEAVVDEQAAAASGITPAMVAAGAVDMEPYRSVIVLEKTDLTCAPDVTLMKIVLVRASALSWCLRA